MNPDDHSTTDETPLPDGESEKLLNDSDAYEVAMQRALALMKEGLHLGGSHKLDREALHDRDAMRQMEPRCPLPACYHREKRPHKSAAHAAIEAFPLE